MLSRAFEHAWDTGASESIESEATRHGVYIEFSDDGEGALATKKLEDLKSKKIRLLNVKRTQDEDGKVVTRATVFIANDKRSHFLEKIEQYADPSQDNIRPKDDGTETRTRTNAPLVDSISSIRAAVLDSFWTDPSAPIPDVETRIEVWLNGDALAIENEFREVCQSLEIDCAEGSLRFPERTVILITANGDKLLAIIKRAEAVAEFRLARETSAFWLDLPNSEQASWTSELLERLDLKDGAEDLAVCILDSGVNWGHPLLSPIIEEKDCLTQDPKFNNSDMEGHGTRMSGVAGYGDLKDSLNSSRPLEVTHRLESVKIWPDVGENAKDLWGLITEQAVSIAEIHNPKRDRILCLAVTSTETRDNGRPTSWSGAIDKICAGVDGGPKRLLVLSAGNLKLSHESVLAYPDLQALEVIHDPAQAWNALTVGAYTELDRITDPQLKDYSVVAKAGELSPFSSTSLLWQDKWPLKPDVVFEGGNLAIDETDFYDESDDLCLITTNHNFTRQLFTSFNMTSAATAYAAWMAAKVKAAYPELKPETIRGLIVHSAEWTEQLKRQFLDNPESPTKDDVKNLVRICGWGVPNLNRALHTAGNALTLIAERQIQPFRKNDKGRYSMGDMDMFTLPWPIEALQALDANVPISLRVTLSYFIEPGPGELGWDHRYRYPSHGLRFSIIRPLEPPGDFEKRINQAARAEGEKVDSSGNSDRWTLGSNSRHKGSIHSDIWTGSPQELASCNRLAVYPIIGWWRERAHLKQVESIAEYSLIVSILTPDKEVDLYTPVLNQIGIPVSV